MDPLAITSLYLLLAWIISGSAALLLIYGVVRVAVSRGLRDHHNWLEKNRRAASAAADKGFTGEPLFPPITPQLSAADRGVD